MRAPTFFIACLVNAGHGLRLHTGSERVQVKLYERRQNMHKSLAMLLQAFNPAVSSQVKGSTHKFVSNGRSYHIESHWPTLKRSSFQRVSDPRMAGIPFSAALLFDCDGVLVETEELHRIAYNMAFEEFGLEIEGKPVEWSVDYYNHLAATVGGGKPKMRYHFTGLGAPEGAPTHPDIAYVWPKITKRDGNVPADEDAGMQLVDELQAFKTDCYKKLAEKAKSRPGVLELMDSAIAMPGLAVGICSASTRAGFEKLVDSVVGQDRLSKLDVIIAGDDVSKKKPDPQIYNVAADRLGLSNTQCLVVEDSMVGLRAAKSAGMKCIITYTSQTDIVDFYAAGADAKLPDFSSGVTASDIFDAGPAVKEDLLPNVRDAK